MTWSRLTLCEPSPRKAIRAALTALTAPIALRSIQGICTSPAIGSQVRPRLCSMPISAAFSTWELLPHEAAGGHRAGDTDLTLAAHFGTGDRRVLLVENRDGASGEQEAHDALFIGPRDEPPVIMQYGGKNSRRPVGGSSHHPSARRVLLVHGKRIGIDPVHEVTRSTLAAQLAVEPGSAARDFQYPGQDAFGLEAEAHAVLHDLP